MNQWVSQVNRWHQEHGLALWGKGHVKNSEFPKKLRTSKIFFTLSGWLNKTKLEPNMDLAIPCYLYWKRGHRLQLYMYWAMATAEGRELGCPGSGPGGGRDSGPASRLALARMQAWSVSWGKVSWSYRVHLETIHNDLWLELCILWHHVLGKCNNT